ncbi:hypothetical protein EC968_000768 [Mortierella alpina]|nr:hypothetical protein EC968_000768 [Mortierella alpina]
MINLKAPSRKMVRTVAIINIVLLLLGTFGLCQVTNDQETPAALKLLKQDSNCVFDHALATGCGYGCYDSGFYPDGSYGPRKSPRGDQYRVVGVMSSGGDAIRKFRKYFHDPDLCSDALYRLGVGGDCIFGGCKIMSCKNEITNATIAKALKCNSQTGVRGYKPSDPSLSAGDLIETLVDIVT